MISSCGHFGLRVFSVIKEGGTPVLFISLGVEGLILYYFCASLGKLPCSLLLVQKVTSQKLWSIRSQSTWKLSEIYLPCICSKISFTLCPI